MANKGNGCSHQRRDLQLEVCTKYGVWMLCPDYRPVCESCARAFLTYQMDHLLWLVLESESFKEGWGKKSLGLRFRGRDGRILDQGSAVN